MADDAVVLPRSALQAITEPPEGTFRSFTAAGKRIDISTRDGRKLVKTPAGWLDTAWILFDNVPEIKFAARFVGNSMSRLRLFAGFIPEPGEDPIEVTDAMLRPELGLSEQVAMLAAAELARIANSTDGQAGLLREWGVCLTITGDSYLVGAPHPDDPSAEEWNVYSTSAVMKKGDDIFIKESESDPGTRLPDDSVVYRIWNRHSRWPGMADSNLRAVLDTAEELLITARQMRAITKSRTNAGILAIPNEMDLLRQVPVVEGSTASAANQLTPFEEQLQEAFITPISDDASASAVVPFVIRGPAAALKEVRHIPVDRTIDEKAVERVDLLVRRLAHGLDLPVEVLLGLSTANHWSAWAISDDTYKAHIEPMVMIPAAALTAVFLRPALLEGGVSPEIVRRIVIGIDPSALVVRPNRAQDAKDAFDRGVISPAALRSYLDFPDTDAPDETVEPEAESDEDATQGGEPIPATQEAVVASARPTRSSGGVRALGARLAANERSLRDRLQVAASAAVSAAVGTAGSRLRARAQNDEALRARVKGLASAAVGRALGEDVGLTLYSVDELFDGVWGDLEGQWEAWVSAAQASTSAQFRTLVADADDPDFAEEAIERYDGNHGALAAAGWLALSASLVGIASNRLFSDQPQLDTRGEYDPTVSVPAGTVRSALATVGGSDEPGADVVVGMFAGPEVDSVLDALDIEVGGYVWQVGSPAHPFEPHQDLAGVEFTSFVDEVLANNEPWPEFSWLFPGDHSGCSCEAIALTERAEKSAEIPVGEAA